jgi:subtilisin family serine protease
MKNYLLVLALVALFNNLNSQNLDQVKLSSQNQQLLEELTIQEQSRKSRVESFLISNPNIKATIKDGISLTHIYDVIDGKPIYKSTDNLNAARATKTTHLQPGGSLGLDLDGSGMTIGVWDGGPAADQHPEFAISGGGSRITIVDGAIVDGDTGFSSHGTHVTGTISASGNVNPDAKGMAPNVNVKSYNWTNDEAEMVVAVNDINSPILISNHSYGVPINQGDGTQLDSWIMGAYVQDSRDIDNISKNNPQYLIVASAGNSGNTSYPDGMFAGFDKLTTDKTAKNNLVIANANPSLTPFNYDLSSLFINGSSSQGPTDDMRIKPDLAADGTGLLSTVPPNAYATFTGTSMAAPNTAGTLILLQQYYNQLYGSYMKSSTLRGLVCHTSVDDIVTVGPDPIFGWGFLDAKKSAETIADANNGLSILDELNLANGETYSVTFSAQAGDKLSATICWTDMPGSVVANGTLNDPTPRLVNDLDLRISIDGTTFLPWKLDYSATSGFSNSKGDNVVDNIERVDIDAPISGVYTLTVSHKGTLQGNVGGPFSPQTQDFALIVTGNNVTLSTRDNFLSRNLVIYPNPSNGEFTISFDSDVNGSDNEVKINIYDLSGRLVYNNRFENRFDRFNQTLSLNNLKSGVYIANISQGQNVTSHKIIIE